MANRERYTGSGDITTLSTDMYLECPYELREKLEAHDALRFVAYPSGLYPASELPTMLGAQTGMDMAWLRDNAHVAMALHEQGCQTEASRAGRAMLTVLHNNRNVLDTVVNDTSRSISQLPRLPVRVHGATLENDREQRIQNDSVGYALWFVSRLMHSGTIKPHADDLDVLAQTVRYLDRVQYWKDADQGHWEEDSRIHTSSIGTVLAGLRDTQKMFDHYGYMHEINIPQLMDKGVNSFYTILSHGLTDISGPALASIATRGQYTWSEHLDPNNQEVTHAPEFDIHRRQYDAALLFLVEPLNIMQGGWAEKIVHDVEQNLLREKGIARYVGDTYWCPGFKELLTIEERTTSADGRLDLRNASAAKVAATKTEAQWTLFDPILSSYWGKRYQQEGNPEQLEKQLKHLDRSLSQLTVQPDGSMKLPELYYHEQDGILDDSFAESHQFRLEAGDHTPLLWSQANLLNALSLFEENIAQNR